MSSFLRSSGSRIRHFRPGGKEGRRPNPETVKCKEAEPRPRLVPVPKPMRPGKSRIRWSRLPWDEVGRVLGMGDPHHLVPAAGEAAGADRRAALGAGAAGIFEALGAHAPARAVAGFRVGVAQRFRDPVALALRAAGADDDLVLGVRAGIVAVDD